MTVQLHGNISAMNSHQRRKQMRRDKKLLASIFKEYLEGLYEVKTNKISLDEFIVEIEEILSVLRKC